VSPVESRRLKELVTQEWLALEDSHDEFNSDNAYQMESVLQYLDDEISSADDAYEDFKLFKVTHEHLFTDEIVDLVLRTANSIASSFHGKNKSELNILFRLEQLLK